MLGLALQGENLESHLWWLDLVTMALEHRFLPEGVVVEEPRYICDVMKWLVRIWSLL